MKKINIITLSLFSSIFLIGFIVSYKNSGKIRESIRIAIIWAIVTLLPISAEAKSSGLPGADGFTPPVHSRPANKDSGLFNQPKPQNQNPGSDKPGGNGSNGDDSNSNFESECIENPKPDNPYHYGHEPMHQSDSETDDESKCSIEEVKVGIANDGTFIHVPTSQVRDKGLHIHDFLDAEILDGKFDVTEAETLEYTDRLNYLRDKNNLPDEIVYQARDEILDFMTADDTTLVPGFLGDSKIEGTVFINVRLNKVGFRDNGSYKFRTAMKMNNKKIVNLAKTGFHLFPNAGKL